MLASDNSLGLLPAHRVRKAARIGNIIVLHIIHLLHLATIGNRCIASIASIAHLILCPRSRLTLFCLQAFLSAHQRLFPALMNRCELVFRLRCACVHSRRTLRLAFERLAAVLVAGRLASLQIFFLLYLIVQLLKCVLLGHSAAAECNPSAQVGLGRGDEMAFFVVLLVHA